MRKLILILIAFIAAATFIRAYDNEALKQGAAPGIGAAGFLNE
ncbi:MAG: hypothetical protein MdMp014T_1776 [Treponematales bacterium]